jgi:hypothetical protein
MPDDVVIMFTMKRSHLIPLLGCGLLLTSCGDFNQPLGGDFDPLMTPGSRQSDSLTAAGNYNFPAGSYVTAASNSTAFFETKPTGNADAEELLAAGTSMRVIKTEGSFVKVELDNGKVGYVAAALLLEGQATGNMAPLPSEVAVPLPSGPVPDDLAPTVAPTDLGPDALPPIAPPSADLPPPAVEKEPSVPLPEPAKPPGNP